MHARRLIAIFLGLLGLLGALSGAALGAQEGEFLKPDEAFRLSATTEGADALMLSWRIADGYYLYRSKLRFRTDTPGIDLGSPQLPAAQTRKDAFFGDVETYRGRLDVRIPLRRRGVTESRVALEVSYQGCADAGLCYPPNTRTLMVGLGAAENKAQTGEGPPGQAAPGAPAERPAPAGGNPLQALARLGRSDSLSQDEILSPDQAYRFSASSEDGKRLHVNWRIADGTYLYRDKIELDLEAADGTRLGAYSLPRGAIKPDGIRPDGSLGDVAVFHHDVDLDIPLIRTATAASEVRLKTRYQGCADRGICYPPINQEIALSLPAIDAPTTGPPDSSAAAAPLSPATAARSGSIPKGSAAVAEQDRLAQSLASGGIWVGVASFFVLGLGLAFTPCVFPMIPILSGIIAGQGARITSRRAFLLSLVYVLAMAATYTAAGVAAALFGENLQAAFQSPWILSAFALVFALLALSMFGFYDLQLPSGLQSRLADVSNRQQGGSLIGVGIMGFLSALIVGPCVAPPLAAALIYIGQTGDALLGGSALFALSLGMGAPLIAIGTSAGKLLPKAGPWMDTVKGVFGVLMLGVALYLLERILAPAIAMALWGTLFVVSSVYMGALKSLPVEATGWARLWKGLGLVLLVYGALMLVGAAAGGRDTVQPLRGLALGAGGASQLQHPAFKPIKTITDLERELAASATAAEPVMLDFYADWCTYCKEFEKYVFSDPKVAAALSSLHLLRADVTDNDDADKALLAHLGIPAPPAILFFGPDGRERRNFRILGYMAAPAFAAHIQEATGR